MLKTLVIVLIVLAVIATAIVTTGVIRWNAGTKELRSGLELARLPVKPLVVDFCELEGLPPPVQRYFRSVLTEGQPMVAGVRLQHRGTMNLSATSEQWKSFTSDQQVVTRRPGFDWNARIHIVPGLSVRVHDAYVDGKGMLRVALLGLFSMADMRGTRLMDEGELMRFFAEAAWYPTALLPSQGVRWEAVSDRSARGTLVDGPIALSMLFAFNDAGVIDTVRADARGRTVGSQIVPTPWQGRFWQYQKRGGMYVPFEGEVAWVTPQGIRAYWRGRITEISYEFAQ
ncbi:MAG: uncharacterized protein JWQ21_520 [Herminiimonas sp.]|nr:uncharacterized protein [Herminiimonas sp.]